MADEEQKKQDYLRDMAKKLAPKTRRSARHVKLRKEQEAAEEQREQKFFAEQGAADARDYLRKTNKRLNPGSKPDV